MFGFLTMQFPKCKTPDALLLLLYSAKIIFWFTGCDLSGHFLKNDAKIRFLNSDSIFFRLINSGLYLGCFCRGSYLCKNLFQTLKNLLAELAFLKKQSAH